MKKYNIITNGLSIQMTLGIQIGNKQIKIANPSNPYWKQYSIGYYIEEGTNIKRMVYFTPNNQFIIIKQQSKTLKNA